MSKYVVAMDRFAKIFPMKKNPHPNAKGRMDIDFAKVKADRAAGIKWPQYDRTKVTTNYYEGADSVCGIGCSFWGMEIEKAKRLTKDQAERMVKREGAMKDYGGHRVVEVEA